MADGYSAGNLEFVVQTISDKTLDSLDKLNAKLKTTMSLLGAMPSLTRNMGTITRTTTGAGTGSSPFDNKQLRVSALSLTKMLNKVYFLRNYTKQMFRSLSGIVEKAVDYTETLNLWQVAMRNNRAEAEQFINTMNKAYGISTQTLMNYQAIFRNMLSSLGGISEVTSYALSEYLTQMALDYASLYNTSIEKAMTTFQAVLSGQVRPIRSIAGYDITETTIYQLYQQLGGTKTMRQLTQTEKRLLRIYAVFQQMESSGAIGDLAKTLDNTANQMRIFTESAKELGTWLGILLENTIKPIFPYLNAFVITLTNIVKAIVKMKGIEMFEGGIESVQEFNEELDETTGKLLSFDRFEALNSTSGNDNIFGIDESLLAGLSKYQSILEGVTGEAQKLAESWTKWWVDEDTGELTKQAKDLLNVLKKIGSVVGIIVGLGITSKLSKWFVSLTGIKGVLSTIFSSWKNFGISAFVTTLVYAYATNERFRKSMNELLLTILKIADALSPIISVIADIVSGVVNFLSKSGLLEFSVYSILAGFIAWKGLKLHLWFIDIAKEANLSLTGIGKVFSKLSLLMRKDLATIAIGWETMSTKAKIASVSIGLVGASLAYLGLDALFSSLDSGGKIIAGIITLIGALTVAIIALHTASSFGVALPILLTSVGAGIAGAKALISGIQGFKTGGQVEDGIFTMSKGEIIGDFDDGTTVVANNQQIISGIQQGVYSAVVSAMRQSGGNGGVGDVYLNGRKVGMATARSSHNENVRTGLVRVNR